MIFADATFAPFGYDTPVHVRMHGTSFGDCRSLNPGGLERLHKAAADLRVGRLLSPRVKFTNQPILLDDAQAVRQESPVIFRSIDNADAGIVMKRNDGLTICNADCPIGLIWHPEYQKLAMLHLGLNCVYRADDSPSVVQTTLELMGVEHPDDVFIWVGGGIGPCCYGFNQVHPLLRKKYGKHIGGPVLKGPRRGAKHEAVNLYGIILKHLTDIGITQPIIDTYCTSCAGIQYPSDEGFGHFFSNVRDADKGFYRNCFIAVLR